MQQTPKQTVEPSSRQVLAIGLGVAVVALLISLMLVRTSSRPALGINATLEVLREANQGFAAGRAQHPDQTRRRRASLVHGQHPQAIVVACSDSRVPPELVLDRGLGDLYVVRTAGHVVDQVALASIQYGVEHLRVPLIIVLGHTDCGAVDATVEALQKPGVSHGALDAVINDIAPAVRLSMGLQGDLVSNAVGAHLHGTMARLQSADTPVGRAIRGARVKLSGGIYDLKSGLVEWVR